MARWLRRAVIGILALYLLCWCVALGVRPVAHRVEMAAPLDTVWTYISDSRNAHEWSVYFDHITPRPVPGSIDGQPGSVRVCYRRADESGPRWSEVILEVEHLKQRRIRTYDVVGIGPAWFGARVAYRVDQFYEHLPDGRSALTFSTVPEARDGVLPTALYPVNAVLFAFFHGPSTRDIFQVNLENIAAAVQARAQGRPYVRPHPYAARMTWEDPED